MLTANEVASLLGLEPRTVYDLFKSGRLPGYRFGTKAIRFDERDVEEFKQKCRSDGTSETSAGASRSSASLRVSDTELAGFFRKRGVEPKLTRSTSKKAGDSTHLRVVSEVETP